MNKKFAFIVTIIAIMMIAAAPLMPRGSYILIRYIPVGSLGGQEIKTDLVFNDQVVCTWNLNNIQPWDRGEENLYFIPVKGNCPSLDERNYVQWNVQQNFAEVFFNAEMVLEIPIWSMDATSRYTLLPK